MIQIPPKETWNGEVKGYRIEYRKYLGGTDFRSEKVFGVNRVHYELKGFNMFDHYEFRMCLVNALGQSRWTPAYVMFMEIGTKYPPIISSHN